MRNKLLLTAMMLGIAGTLAACSNREGPDEFAVLKNPPLVMPPDYHLRPPGDESDVRGAYTPQEIAKRALFGSPDS